MDRYEIIDVIASGGMATVWRARDHRLGRVVAIKRPHPAPDGSDVDARFAREARAAATVSHPNLVSVYDTGADESGPFLVMEYVDGPSVAEAQVEPDRAATIGAAVAAGLAALHDAGVVHGDIKPANILLADGRPQLTDFGIARSVDDPTLTRAGVAFGTPAYAAPETLRAGVHTPAADVYSLAAVVYEMSTGERWANDSAGTVAMPTDGIADVLAAALSADPADRPTAAAFAAALAGPTGAEFPPPAPPTALPAAAPTTPMRPPQSPAEPERSRAPVAVVSAVLIGAVVVGAAVLAAQGGGGDTISANPGDTAVAPTADTTPPTTGPPTTAPVTTAPATTAPPTTAPPTTEAPDPADELVDLVEANAPGAFKPKESREIVDRFDRAAREIADGDEDRAEEQLRRAADDIERHVRGDLRDEMERLLIEIADMWGLDPDEITEPFDEDR